MVVITDGGINGVVVRRVPLYINLFMYEISIRLLLLYIPQPRSQVMNLNNSRLAH